MIKSRTMLVVIAGDMVQYMPTGQHSDWTDAEMMGAPEWVGHYLRYKDFDVRKGLSIKKTANDYIIEQRK